MADFQWDPRKAATNLHKHGVRFSDAVGALEDPRALTIEEDTAAELRYITIGMDAFARVLVVVYVWRQDIIRIISARPATPHELETYLENT